MVWIVIACMALSIGVCLPLYRRYKITKLGLSLTYKALGTACALIPAISGAVPLGEAAWFCVAALVLCILGDIFLELQFFLGVGFFMLGHICYIMWFFSCISLPRTLSAVLPVLVVTAAGIAYGFRKEIGKKRMLPFVTYMLFLSVMASFAICYGLITLRADGLLSLAGGVFFVVSDFFVLYQTLRPTQKWFGYVTMVLYYAGQLLIASGCMARAIL